MKSRGKLLKKGLSNTSHSALWIKSVLCVAVQSLWVKNTQRNLSGNASKGNGNERQRSPKGTTLPAGSFEAEKSAKQSVVELEHRIKGLAEIIKYAQQYKDNRSYHIGYKKAKNPDAYFRRYESQIILYGGARRMLEQAGINLKGLNVDKLKAEYQELMKQKSELASTYKDCEKEVRELNRKLENLNKYLGRIQPDPAQEQQTKKDTPNL